MAEPEADDPIRRQFLPDPREALSDPFALDDPLGEKLHRVTPRLVHQYRDKALLLSGGSCAGFCRYCFRRVRLSSPEAFISAEELKPVLAYLQARPDIKEILVSGGDPLAAGNAEIENLFGKLRKAREDISIRLCSRVPITLPERLDAQTIKILTRFKPLRIATQINHPREIAEASALSSVVKAGIPVLVQTVLLRGINDRAETLAALFNKCLGLGLKPYYLFQLDLAPGISHFRVPLKTGLAIYRELESLVSDLPPYAVDLPGGGGKIRLSEGVIAGEEERPGGRVYLLKGGDGRLWEYPAE